MQTCGFCHTPLFYTSESMQLHKTCVARLKPVKRQQCMSHEEYQDSLNPVKKTFPVEKIIVPIEGYTEQESAALIHQAFLHQNLRYMHSNESNACIEKDTQTWMLTKSRFSIEDAHRCLSKDYSLLLFKR